jgi:hypothetical protein
LGLSFRRTPFSRWRTKIYELAASDCPPTRRVSDDKAVWNGGSDRLVEHELNVCRGAGRNGFVVEQRDMRTDLGCAVVKADRKPLADRLLLALQNAEHCVDAIGRRVQIRIEHDIAAMDRIF